MINTIKINEIENFDRNNDGKVDDSLPVLTKNEATKYAKSHEEDMKKILEQDNDVNVENVDSCNSEKMLAGVDYSPEEYGIIQEALKDIENITPEEIENIPVLKELVDKYVEKYEKEPWGMFDDEKNVENVEDNDSKEQKKTTIRSIILASLASTILTGCVNGGYARPTTPSGSILGAVVTCGMFGDRSYQCKQAQVHAARVGVLDADVNGRKIESENAYKYGMNNPYANCNVFQNSYERQSCRKGQRIVERENREYRRKQQRLERQAERERIRQERENRRQNRGGYNSGYKGTYTGRNSGNRGYSNPNLGTPIN